MSNDLLLLTAAAGSIGFIHTLLGPDHYLPFIVMAKARGWSVGKTAWITALCGVGHVGGSVVLGFVGIAAGVALHGLELTESTRGNIAAWLLIAFGLGYGAWGLRRAIRNRPHTHRHQHETHAHAHEHNHDASHAHVHDQSDTISLTPWILFTIFVFGPCEPLIPILMYPAASERLWGVGLVTAVFAAATIGTMLVIVLAGTAGLSLISVKPLARYSHALAGAAILLCGVAIHLGL